MSSASSPEVLASGEPEKGAGASNKAVVAVARELSGFVWALMVEIEETLEGDAMPSVA